MKRIALLILTNIAIVVMLGIVLNVVSLLTGINFGQMAGKWALPDRSFRF